jgi:hypothetical protein
VGQRCLSNIGDNMRCTAIIKSGKKRGEQCPHPAHVGYKRIVCLKHTRNSPFDRQIFIDYRDRKIDYEEAMRRTKNE